MDNAELARFEKEIIEAIKKQTEESIKHTGHAWIEDAVSKIVPQAIQETLVRLGMDYTNPLEMQKDLGYLRQSRLDSADTFKAVKRMVIGWITPIIISLYLLVDKINR